MMCNATTAKWKNKLLTIMVSSTGNIFRFTGSLWEESIDHQWCRSQKASYTGFDVFFDVSLNKQ